MGVFVIAGSPAPSRNPVFHAPDEVRGSKFEVRSSKFEVEILVLYLIFTQFHSTFNTQHLTSLSIA